MSVEENIQRLSRLTLLSKLEPAALRLIAFAAETKRLRAGDILFRQGDHADCGYLLISGALSIDNASDEAAKIVHEGDLLGELALIVATRRPVTAIARQPCDVLKISRALFLRVLEEYPSSAERMRRDLLAQVNSLGSELEAYRRGLIADNSLQS